MALGMLDSLLEDLGKILKIPHLHSNARNTCAIRLRHRGPAVQIEMDREGLYLHIGSIVGTLSAGKYRENVFREALRANGLPPPRYGIFGFTGRGDRLVLFERLPIKDLTAREVADVVQPLTDKATEWAEALSKGLLPQVNVPGKAYSSGPGFFGLRP